MLLIAPEKNYYFIVKKRFYAESQSIKYFKRLKQNKFETFGYFHT